MCESYGYEPGFEWGEYESEISALVGGWRRKGGFFWCEMVLDENILRCN